MQNVLFLLLLSSPVLVLSGNNTGGGNDTATQAPGGGGNGGNGTGDTATTATADTATTATVDTATTATVDTATTATVDTTGNGTTSTTATTTSSTVTEVVAAADADTNTTTETATLPAGVTPSCPLTAASGYSCTTTGHMVDVSKTWATNDESCCAAAASAVEAALKAQANAQKNVLKALVAKTFTAPDVPAGLAITSMPTSIEAPAADGSVKIKGADFGAATDTEIGEILKNRAFVAATCLAISAAINPVIMQITLATRRLEAENGRRLEAKDLKMSVMSDADIATAMTGVSVCGTAASTEIAKTACATGLKFNDYGVCAGSPCNSTIDAVQGLCCMSSQQLCATIPAGDGFCGTGRTLKVADTDKCAATCTAAEVETCCNAASTTPGTSNNAVVFSASVAFFLAMWQ